MTLRSWLFVPGDSERKLEKAESAGADALILDLEDAVAPERKATAREAVRGFLDARPRAGRRTQLWVRVNPLGDTALSDLAAIMGGAPNGIMIPKTEGPADLLRLSHHLEAFEAAGGLPDGSTGILPVATETPVGTLRLSAFAEARLPRLAAMTWGAEDLSTAIGAATNRDPEGGWAFTYRWARSALLLAAKATGALALDTLYADFRDAEGLRRDSKRAAAEGFDGRIAIHPAQVEVINAAFAPSPEAVEQARRVVAAFQAAPSAGAVSLDGRMLDIPHLKQARNILARHDAVLARQ
ncbi:citrate lyase subunit beta / citryl-CoA lyase [Tistlia consotensis]|uniref:Citrate lyase subunit beta / citryl-CoA lyase n=1 Tax=Tistlia consotensis USBA 355 TaxID=560819 RepID=A0A1Y6CPB3_9PROT|nr:CoA ester lyase [Tistlia consotensis]SMF65794.1 citrate lyase subunit beta / citryl-CoA lyase [Tistlia consotensis USBA 355]SNS03163.1 citrate lyase subunit beta / citryl-CoA lyase [Tistlia consotensis]